MSSVEILQSCSSEDLEERINQILKSLEVVDIKYSMSTFRGDTLYSAMIIYK